MRFSKTSENVLQLVLVLVYRRHLSSYNSGRRRSSSKRSRSSSSSSSHSVLGTRYLTSYTPTYLGTTWLVSCTTLCPAKSGMYLVQQGNSLRTVASMVLIELLGSALCFSELGVIQQSNFWVLASLWLRLTIGPIG